MLTVAFVLVLIWVVAGVVGFLVDGLFWLFVLACVLFLLTLLGAAYQRGRSAASRRR